MPHGGFLLRRQPRNNPEGHRRRVGSLARLLRPPSRRQARHRQRQLSRVQGIRPPGRGEHRGQAGLEGTDRDGGGGGRARRRDGSEGGHSRSRRRHSWRPSGVRRPRGPEPVAGGERVPGVQTTRDRVSGRRGVALAASHGAPGVEFGPAQRLFRRRLSRATERSGEDCVVPVRARGFASGFLVRRGRAHGQRVPLAAASGRRWGTAGPERRRGVDRRASNRRHAGGKPRRDVAAQDAGVLPGDAAQGGFQGVRCGVAVAAERALLLESTSGRGDRTDGEPSGDADVAEAGAGGRRGDGIARLGRQQADR
mmetsp:Transcript_3049/g.13193  ORF Transcript_3049/g.13193 Transcript_3049/m.13193 type:complete len:310 (+) Transcript_3049:242-1171(+)